MKISLLSLFKKNKYLAGFLVVTPLVVAVVVANTVLAEQSGSSPESGAVSRIVAVYNSLVSLGNGSEEAGSWGDWGSKWNRIRSASEYIPSGNATMADVRAGQTFYSNGRNQQTGTYPKPSSCETQQYHDSFGASVTQSSNCVDGISWISNPNPVLGDEAKGYDPRTGLTWSQLLVNSGGTPTFSPNTNSLWNWDGNLNFTVTSASATAGATYTNNGQTFTVVSTITSATSLIAGATGSPTSSGTLTKTSGTGDATITFSALANGANNVAVGSKTAKQLCLERGNGWRLPTQKELMQAYIDGSYFNLTQTGYHFWSATESSAPVAWYVSLSSGTTYVSSKSSTSYQVRCVR